MKRTFLSVLICSLFTTVMAQVERPVESKISGVTVFLDKAQVQREIKTRLEAGNTYLIVRGLTSSLDPQSIQVSGKGNFTILGLTHQQNFLNESNVPVALKILRDSVEFYQRQLAIEQSQKEILNKEEQLLVSNQKIGGSEQNLSVVELKSMADFYRTRFNEILVSRMKHDQNIKKINERIVKLQRQINEQNELHARNTSEIIIGVSADVATTADLKLNYIVHHAGWQPVYDIRAVNTKSPIQLSYKANVYQNTGEEWKNVKLKLSTANPNLGGVKPELYPWYLNFDQPYQQLRGRVNGVAAKSAPAPEAAYDREEVETIQEAASTADYVTTIQTTLNTEFNIAIPYTVESSKKPTLVDIQNHKLEASYIHSTTPKLDKDVFLLAKITGWEAYSLLPGEANVFFEGTFVTKTHISPENIKDTLAVSLGRDKRIIVQREKLKDFTSTKFIGSNQRNTYAYEISIRNTTNEGISVTVEDHIPVSQNNQIEVSLLESANAKSNSNTGKLVWTLDLKPNENKKLVYKFEVKFPKDKEVPAL